MYNQGDKGCFLCKFLGVFGEKRICELISKSATIWYGFDEAFH